MLFVQSTALVADWQASKTGIARTEDHLSWQHKTLLCPAAYLDALQTDNVFLPHQARQAASPRATASVTPRNASMLSSASTLSHTVSGIHSCSTCMHAMEFYNRRTHHCDCAIYTSESLRHAKQQTFGFLRALLMSSAAPPFRNMSMSSALICAAHGGASRHIISYTRLVAQIF